MHILQRRVFPLCYMDVLKHGCFIAEALLQQWSGNKELDHQGVTGRSSQCLAEFTVFVITVNFQLLWRHVPLECGDCPHIQVLRTVVHFQPVLVTGKWCFCHFGAACSGGLPPHCLLWLFGLPMWNPASLFNVLTCCTRFLCSRQSLLYRYFGLLICWSEYINNICTKNTSPQRLGKTSHWVC